MLDNPPVRIVLERCPQRCSECWFSKSLPPDKRPFLFRFRLNETAKNEMVLKTGGIPAEEVRCLATECSAVLGAMSFINEIGALRQ